MSEPIKNKRPPTSSKIDISGAKTIKTETIKEAEETAKIDNNVETEEYVKDLKDQKTINLDDVGKSKSGEKVTIDFLDEDHINKFTAGETKKSEENPDDTKGNFDGKSADDLRDDIKKAEEQANKSFTAKDFEDIASFIIFLIDTGIASTLKWWSKDTSESAYSLPEGKKKMLTYQLTLILVKYQAKFSLEFMFILTLLIIYAPAFMKARERKKEIKNASQVTYQEPVTTTQESSNVVNETAEIKKPNVGAFPKRKKGGQSKI